MSTGESEKIVQRKIVDMLKRNDFWVLKIHGGMYQRPGIPDLLAIKDGKAYWLEVKRPGKKPTALQNKILSELQAVGCVAGFADSVDDARRIVGVHERVF